MTRARAVFEAAAGRGVVRISSVRNESKLRMRYILLSIIKICNGGEKFRACRAPDIIIIINEKRKSSIYVGDDSPFSFWRSMKICNDDFIERNDIYLYNN